jgi:hypothetical protein
VTKLPRLSVKNYDTKTLTVCFNNLVYSGDEHFGIVCCSSASANTKSLREKQINIYET